MCLNGTRKTYTNGISLTATTIMRDTDKNLSDILSGRAADEPDEST